jgi:hypothetical protein
VVVAGEMRADEQEQHRRGELGLAVLAEEAFGSGGGEVGLSPGEVQLDAGTHRIAVVLGTNEQLRGLGKPSLTYPKCGQADDGGGAQGAVAAIVEMQGGEQLTLGIGPSTPP